MSDTSTSVSTTGFVSTEPDGTQSLNVLVDGMHCPSCVVLIENALRKQTDVITARLNLSTKRLRVTWKGAKEYGNTLVSVIQSMGYRAVPFDPATLETQEKKEEKFLLRCLAVAGFASGNMMLFSVPIWSADTISMGMGTLTLFHWVQALIAIPTIAYAGIPFYRSAFTALRKRSTNMDVPISVAIILATLMSLFETITHGTHAYFDSGVMLIFFLLIGRYLEARARGRARGAAHDLLQMMTGSTTIILADGTHKIIPLGDIAEGMTLAVATGEKISADGTVLSGSSDLDTSLITGETLPRSVTPGDTVFAGTINLSAPIQVTVTRCGEHSLLAEIIKLMETAEQAQARYVTLADQISHWYTPVVHILALGTFLFWFFVMHIQWQIALLYAATVLIITCPCALGLAVPVVQVLASGYLMRRGILLKSGSALERLASITHVVFDKTGTLTIGKVEPLNMGDHNAATLQLAASLAVYSKHALAQALARHYTGTVLPLTAQEIPGHGMEATYKKSRLRLGKRSWCGDTTATDDDSALELWFSKGKNPPVRFTFSDHIRNDAKTVITTLAQAQLGITLLSGDRAPAVSAVAHTLGIADARAGLLPAEKAAILEALKTQGHKVLMVGDGLNDAPSLAAASVSMSPASAIDITQNAADIVFQGEMLSPILTAWNIAKFSQILVRQNFLLAIAYNVVAIPLAVAGYVTPLIAAIAMSSSSLVVIANALRLNLRKDT